MLFLFFNRFRRNLEDKRERNIRSPVSWWSDDPGTSNHRLVRLDLGEQSLAVDRTVTALGSKRHASLAAAGGAGSREVLHGDRERKFLRASRQALQRWGSFWKPALRIKLLFTGR